MTDFLIKFVIILPYIEKFIFRSSDVTLIADETTTLEEVCLFSGNFTDQH